MTDVDTVEHRLRNFAQGCRGSMWQSRDQTIELLESAADEIARLKAALPPAVPDVSKWQNIDGMIYNLVDDETRWENGKRPQMNQYMIRFERQNKAGGSDEELKALQTFIHRALTATPDPVAEANEEHVCELHRILDDTCGLCGRALTKDGEAG